MENMKKYKSAGYKLALYFCKGESVMNRKELNLCRDKIKEDMNSKFLEVALYCVNEADKLFSEFINDKNKLIEDLKDYLEKSDEESEGAKLFVRTVGDLIHKFYNLDKKIMIDIAGILKAYQKTCKPICLDSANTEADILYKNMHLFPNRKYFEIALNSAILKATNKYEEVYNMLHDELIGNIKYLLDFFDIEYTEAIDNIGDKSFIVNEEELKDLLDMEGSYAELVAEPIKKDKAKPKKTFDYKCLNKLAIENGYVFDRQSGDHAQYVKDGKAITIPQGRSIGKGLSMKIQKSIKFSE